MEGYAGAQFAATRARGHQVVVGLDASFYRDVFILDNWACP